MLYCLKNITKCPYCKLQVDIKHLPTHIEEAVAIRDGLVQAVQTNDIELLRKVYTHGGDIMGYKVSAE
jgi:heterodisulfide reductase subunit C